MNLNKHLDFFNPLKFDNEEINIIGCGAIGSNLANQLKRLGFKNLVLYDFDTVDEHNITNQLYTRKDIGTAKVTALAQHLTKIDEGENLIIVDHEGWKPNTKMRGYVFLCVDSIELRNKILTNEQYNPHIKFITDMRIGLEEAQMYSADWQNDKAKERTISTTEFKDDEVTVPVNACGTSLNVLPTIQMIVSIGVMNFINFLKNNEYNYQGVIDSIQGIATSYKNK